MICQVVFSIYRVEEENPISETNSEYNLKHYKAAMLRSKTLIKNTTIGKQIGYFK